MWALIMGTIILLVLYYKKNTLSTTCNNYKSGRSLSWKVQENNKGTLIQLVWKAEPESGPVGTGKTTRSDVEPCHK